MNNDTPKLCNSCETLNSPESIFCKHCGIRLSGATIDPALDAGLRNEIDSFVKAKMEQMNKLEAILEDKIELNSIKKIDGWIRTGGILGAVLVVLGGGAAWFSINEKVQQTKGLANEKMEEIQKQAEKVKQEIKSQSETVNNRFENAKSVISKMELDAQKNMKEFEGIKTEIEEQNKKIIDQAKMAQDASDIALRASQDVQKIKEKTTRDVASVSKELNKQKSDIQKTENATFNIFVDLDGNTDSEVFKRAMGKLQDKGFRISDSNVLQTGVDHNQIVYYSMSDEVKARANDIKNILKNDYEDIQVIPNLTNKSRGASDLRLKLKSGTN